MGKDELYEVTAKFVGDGQWAEVRKWDNGWVEFVTFEDGALKRKTCQTVSEALLRLAGLLLEEARDG